MRWISAFLCVLCIAASADAAGCGVGAPSFPFGTYDPAAPLASDTLGQVNVSCAAGTVFRIGLDAGRNSGGSFRPRRLIGSGGGTLDYNLYVDAARTQVWGDGTDGTVALPGVASGNWDSFVVYGRLPARQNVPAGRYEDQVVLTVEW